MNVSQAVGRKPGCPQVVRPLVERTDNLLMVWLNRGTPVGRLSLFFGGSELTDALGHVILCGILAWLWYQALRSSSRHVSALSIAVAIGLGLGIVTELAQSFVPSRGASPIDMLANVLWGWGWR